MMKNRSIPDCSVIPVLYYPDVRKAVDWLCSNLRFEERLRIGDHRCQLLYGNGSIVVANGGLPADGRSRSTEDGAQHSTMLRVVEIDALFERARAAGAVVDAAPTDHVYGERQCSFHDPWGHGWTLSQTIADADPATWGGELVG